jgi:hypothetical protein
LHTFLHFLSRIFISTLLLSTLFFSTLHPSHVCKNVHFPSQEEGGLATVRVFNRSAKPASLSRLGEETETETEGEGSSSGTTLYGNGGWAGWSGKYVNGSTFPFPRVPQEKEREKKSPLNPSSSTYQKRSSQFEIDWSQSSPIPRNHACEENVSFDSLQVIQGVDDGISTPLLLFNSSLIQI